MQGFPVKRCTSLMECNILVYSPSRIFEESWNSVSWIPKTYRCRWSGRCNMTDWCQRLTSLWGYKNKSIFDGQWGKTYSAFAYIHCMVWCYTNLFYQRLWNPFLFLSWRYSVCLSCCVVYLLHFCLLYEKVMIMIWNRQFYILIICVCNLVSHVKERI